MEIKLLSSVKQIYILSLGVIIASMVAWHWPLMSAFITILSFALVLFLSIKNPAHGLAVAVFEIILGSLGKFFNTGSLLNFNVSWRLAIFCGLLIGTLIHLLLNHQTRQNLFHHLKSLKTYLIVLPIIVWATVVGVWQNKLNLVYSDANAWLYFTLLIPALCINYNREYLQQLLKIFIGACLATITLTILIYVLYGWGLIAQPLFSWLYPWLRQVGWGEVTHVSGNLYRVFSQAQIMVLALWSMAFGMLTVYRQNHGTKVVQLLLFLSTLALIINLSRSMWLGAVAVIMFLLITNIKKVISQWRPLLVILIASVLVSGLLIGRLGIFTLATRVSQQPSEPAIASRIVQLVPLYNGIKAHWLAGAGFGGQIGYPSQDPRAKMKLDANGLYWTSAFEWGYLDQLYKFGLFVFTAFMFFIGKILFTLYQRGRADEVSNIVLLSLLAIYVTHIFSPYLNHPLGISWLIVGIIVINNNTYAIKSDN